MPLKKYLHDVDLVANQLLNSRLHNVTTAQRTALGATLGISDIGYQVYDTTLLTPYFWTGSTWNSGIAPSLTWGSISGTLTAQTDLINYLVANYYPRLTNPAGYLTSFTETDPTVPAAVKAITNTQISNWDTAYGWGNHATAGYLTSALAASTYVPLNRNITINGTTFDLSADRSWTISTAATTWGSITGTLSSQTDLQNALNAKFNNPTGTTLQYLRGDGSLATFPTIPAAQVNSDWNAVSGVQEILNKPLLATVATSGDYNDLLNLPIIPSAILTALPWSANHTTATGNEYLIGDLVYYSGNVYECIANNDSIIPTSTSYWVNLGAGFPLIQEPVDWNATTGNNQILNKPAIPTVGTWGGLNYPTWVSGTPFVKMTGVGTFALDTNTYLTSISSLDVTTALGYTPVTNARSITINGTSQDLTADRTWSVGTVTSVGLTMPAAFNVGSSPVTGAGTLAVTGAGLPSQYIRGDGSLADFPTNVGGGSSVNYYLNGSVSQGTFGGDVYYELSKVPVVGGGTTFTRLDAQGNGYIASFITDAGDPNLLQIPGGNFHVEFYFSASSGGGSPSFYTEIYKVSNTNVFTFIASDSAFPEGITNGTSIDVYYTTISVPQTPLLATDRLAIRIFVTTSGRNVVLHTENGTLSELITTFSTGLASLNGLSVQTQFFTQGTSGTDFNISSALDTHTFNLPFASASANGKLSIADWLDFKSKQSALNGTGFVKAIGTSISYDNTNYTPESRTITINGLAQDLSANRTWSVGDILSTGSYADPSWITSLDWSKITNVPALGGINSLNGLTGTSQTFANDTNVIINSAGTVHTLGWSGTLADSRIASAANWNSKEPGIALGTTLQYWRGDKTWQTLDKSAVGLSNVDNTSDLNKPISTATQTALNAKEDSIAAGTILQYWRGDKTWQTLNTAAVPESGNLYYTDARARQSISLTTIGSSGAATYNNTTGVLNVPTYGGVGGSGFGYTLIMGFNVTALAASETYVMGTLYGSGAITLFENRPSRWVLCPKVGNIVSASLVVQLNSASYGSPSTSQMQIRVHNITQNTNSPIDTTYQITSGLFSGSPPARNTFYNITPLQVNQGDQLQVRVITPAWTTAPSTMSMNVILFIE
jgi:hypothetical protein